MGWTMSGGHKSFMRIKLLTPDGPGGDRHLMAMISTIRIRSMSNLYVKLIDKPNMALNKQCGGVPPLHFVIIEGVASPSPLPALSSYNTS